MQLDDMTMVEFLDLALEHFEQEGIFRREDFVEDGVPMARWVLTENGSAVLTLRRTKQRSTRTH
jgi:hypothetical protein